MSLSTYGCDPSAEPATVSAAVPAAVKDAKRLPPIRPFILAGNLERSLEFYRDLLKFDVLLIADYDSPHMRKFIEMPATSVPKVAIMSDNGVDLAFSIVSIEGVPVDRASNKRNAPQLVLNRSDVLGLYEIAQQAGYEIVFAPTESFDDDDRLVARELGVIDPDGIRILVIEVFSSYQP